MYATLYLKRNKEDSLRRFHPWIFSGAIARTDRPVEEGDLVRIVSDDGTFLAVGHAALGTIAVRTLSFQDEPVDAAFWRRRIREAYSWRQSLGMAGGTEQDIFRLVHGEGDGLSGLIIDVYGGTAVIQAHTVGMHIAREEIAEAVREVLAGRLEAIYYKSDTTLPYPAEVEAENGFLWGKAPKNVATEQGLKFRIDWLKGQKTGFFIDQRENRQLLERYAANRTVLNMFGYTGGFSVYALRGKAQAVHTVDSSAKAIALTNENVALNFPNDTRHQSFAEDAFDFLDKAVADTYNLIVLDPPAFAKRKDALRNALKGYTRLNGKAFRKIQKGGILFTFSCSQAVSKEQFRLAVFTAAAESGREVRILHQLHQPADHPVNIYHPEGEYLKGLVLAVD